MKLPKGTLTDDVTELKRYALELERALAAEREALAGLVSIIDKAGLLNLSNGVQLGATSWYVKASDAMDYARELLRSRAPEPQANHQRIICDTHHTGGGAYYKDECPSCAPEPQAEGDGGYCGT
jgi:hypothetical protein